MNSKKVISTLLIISVIASQSLANKAFTESNYIAKDIDSHWAEEEISTLMNADILKGYQHSTNPNSSITRGEFTALAARTLNLESNGGEVFDDIPNTHIFFNEIDAASDAGIINGVGNDMFMPDRTITREEIMLIISRCTPKRHNKEISFSDINKNYIYYDELKTSVSTGIITGYNDGTFRPKSNASRAECAVMLTRLLKLTENIDKEKAIELGRKYIENDLENVDFNTDLSIGRANSELDLKRESKKILLNNLTQVEKLPHSINLKSYTSDGSLASAVFTGDITYVVTNQHNTRNKTYTATYKVDIISRDNVLYVYNYNMSLLKKEKINLTWEVYSTPPDYAPEGVNVVSPSSFQISSENLGVENKPLLEGIKFYNSLTRKYMDYATKNNYEVWPIYKTDFSLKTSNSFLNNFSARQKSIEYLIEYACKYMIDGINIDFENIYERNRHLVTQHAREISVMLHELGLIVSVDITRLEPTSSNWSMCYDRDSLNDNTDYIMLMAYDEYYASSPKAGSVASLDWTEESIKRTLNEVSNEKLILGIPFYMRYFEVVGNKVTSSKAISMQTAYELINSNNVTYTYMESDRQYKISWKNGNKTCVFWLENTDTIADRVGLANKYSLAGIASWRRGLEISKVWTVIYENL